MSKRTIIIAAIAILALLAALFSAYSDKKTVTPETDTQEEEADDLDEEVENIIPEPEKKSDLTVKYEKPGTDTDTEKV